MKIRYIRLRNFKRFYDTSIGDIPASAKLIVVVGPNGSGKSSLFDAFHQWYRLNCRFGIQDDPFYYRKEKEHDFDYNRSVNIEFHDYDKPFDRNGMYFRTAYRNEPDFNIAQFKRQQAPTEGIRFRRFVDNDIVVSQNYQRLVYNTMTEVYDEANNDMRVEDLRDELIGRIKTSMTNVFEDLVLNNISDPLGQGSFFFRKGTSHEFHYKNLSGGEKAAFDILLDFLIKQRWYNNTVFIIDEPESHLHTSLQGKLIRELFSIVPDNSQLWITTHTLGVMKTVKDLSIEHPGSSYVIDFNGVDFDKDCVLRAEEIDRVLWEKFLEMSLEDLSDRIMPSVIYLCEGSIYGSRRNNFDASIFNMLFRDRNPEIVFVSGGSNNELEREEHIGAGLLSELLKNVKIIRILDRDDKSPDEIQKLRDKGYKVLQRRHLESYLYDDEVIEKLVRINSYGDDQVQQLLELKREAIKRSIERGNATDDVKSAAGEIYNDCKRVLELTLCGSNADAFMRDTLAPLITEDMKVYQELAREIL